MPKSVLTRKRSLIARIAVLAMIFSLMAVALPASATSVALDTTGPCPTATPSAGFTDIGALDATTQTAINCLFAFGITTGTSATTYSPNDTITRWQMALFLIRQAADHGIVIPAAASQGYTDIGAFDTATQNAINQITQLGISKGTTTTTFSPNDGVTRWQMALFIYRTGQAAGVVFANSPAHNEFLDIGTLSAEAQTAINALADTRPDPEGHIALGTGLSAFSPNLVLVRWQMALFLTRLLAADNVAPASGTAVVVSPSTQATQATGTARAYTATLKNADGTAYSGQAIIRLVDANADGTPNGSTAATNVDIEAVDGAALAGLQTTTTVFVGVDGAISFVIRHNPATAAADAVPQVIRDTNTNGTVDSGESLGNGGATFWTFVPAEAPSGAGPSVWDVCSTNAAEAFFVTDITDGDCAVITTAASVEYDDNDIYLGDAITFAEFVAALSVGDTVTAAPYAAGDAGQSTFTLADVVTPLTVDAVTTPVDAATQTLSGTGNPGWEVVIYRDQPVADTYSGALDPAVTAVLAVDADGSWSGSVPLLQDTTNDFIAVQRAAGSSTTGAPAGGATTADPNVEDVPTITESANTNAQITSVTGSNGGVAGVLDVGDTIAVLFNEDVQAAGAGDSIDILETVGGTQVRLIVGTNANAAINAAADTITFTVTSAPTVLNVGDDGVLSDPAVVQAIGGVQGIDGGNVNVAGSPGANRTIAAF